MTTTPANIRYFCVALPNPRSTGFRYLKSIDAAGLRVMARSIGVSFLNAEPWTEVAHLFTAPLADKYVNVVCAPMGLRLGAPMTAAEMAVPELEGMPQGGRPESPGEGHRVVYEPSTALSGLYTEGVPNVAITMPYDSPPEEELAALQKYDYVLCPTFEAMRKFKSLGVEVFKAHPDYPALLQYFFSRFL